MLCILHLIRPASLAMFDTIPLKGKANRIRNFRELTLLFYGQQLQSLPLEGSVAARAQ